MKSCYTCKTEKPYSEFHNSPSTRDGLASSCRECSCKAAKEWYRNNRDRAVKKQREYYEKHKEESGRQSRAWARANPDRMREYRKRWAEKNRGKHLESQRASYRKRASKVKQKYLHGKYGIGPDDVARMSREQGGRCAICPKTKPGGKHGVWHVDHDHKTGKVRGLLCAKCNWMLGNAEDCADRLRSGAAELEAGGFVAKERAA